MRITAEIYKHRVGREPTPAELAACCAENGWSKLQHLPRAIVGPEDAEISYVTANSPVNIALTAEQRENPVCVGRTRVCFPLESVREIVGMAVDAQGGAHGPCAELAIALKLLEIGLTTNVETSSVGALDCRILFKERMAEENITKRDLARRSKVTNRTVERFFRKRPDRLWSSAIFVVAYHLGVELEFSLSPTLRRMREDAAAQEVKGKANG